MCGHGTIGILTFGLEHGLIRPRTPGELRVEVPAGLLHVTYESEGDRVASVRIRNVVSYVAATDVQVEVPGFGSLRVDVSYGGNYYAIVEPQGPYIGLDALGASRIIELSVQVRERVRAKVQPVHPLEPSIRGVSHVLWADRPKSAGADGRNAVFYGERALDRSPCGTGTSARMAHLVAQGKLKPGDRFVHESYIGSRFIGRVEERVQLAGLAAIVPSIEGSARVTGINTLWIDDADPFWRGFQVI